MILSVSMVLMEGLSFMTCCNLTDLKTFANSSLSTSSRKQGTSAPIIITQQVYTHSLAITVSIIRHLRLKEGKAHRKG